jgi:hypothetical protein
MFRSVEFLEHRSQAGTYVSHSIFKREMLLLINGCAWA